MLLEGMLNSFVSESWIRGIGFARAERVDKSFGPPSPTALCASIFPAPRRRQGGSRPEPRSG